MAAVTDTDVLEARVARIEHSLLAVERRLDAMEKVEPIARPDETGDEQSAPLLELALVGRSVLIVGGAYLLRALTENGWIPQVAGVALAFGYAMAWIVVADRALERGRHPAASYDAATAALIAGALLWEATTRFRVLTTVTGALLVVVAAGALLVVANRRESKAIAWIGVTMTAFTFAGLAVGTGDLLPLSIASTLLGVAVWRTSAALVIVSDFFALALLGMALMSRTPQSRLAVGIVLVATAVLWLVVIEARGRWPESIQTAAALLIGAGGASLLAFEAFVLAVLWSVMSVATAWIGRSASRRQWTLQAPLWILAATAAGLASNTLPAVGALAPAAFVLAPPGALYPRLIPLMVATVALLSGVGSLLATVDAGVLAMERSILLALAAVVLWRLGREWREASIAARIVLGFGALKLLFEDFRIGRAATIAVALVAFGTALLLISRKGASMKRILAVVVLIAFSPAVSASDEAAALYKSKCAMCHGAAGKGETPMGKKLAVKSLESAEVQKKSDDALKQVIVKGGGKMPPYGDKLSGEQIKALVGMVRSFAKK